MIILISSGCRKYEEGPLINFQSKKGRLQNKWIFNKYFLDGKEFIIGVRDENYLEFKKNGEYILNIDIGFEKNKDYIGSWEFCNSKKDLIIHSPEYTYRKIKYHARTDTFRIIKLVEDEIWLEQNGKSEYRYIPF